MSLSIRKQKLQGQSCFAGHWESPDRVNSQMSILHFGLHHCRYTLQRLQALSTYPWLDLMDLHYFGFAYLTFGLVQFSRQAYHSCRSFDIDRRAVHRLGRIKNRKYSKLLRRRCHSIGRRLGECQFYLLLPASIAAFLDALLPSSVYFIPIPSKIEL